MTTAELTGRPVATSFAGEGPTEWYLESSALVKLFVHEERSIELGRWLRALEEAGGSVFVSELGRTEAFRAIVRADPELARDVGLLLDDLARVEVREREFEQAQVLQPPELRTLDALHLAVVVGHVGRSAGIVTYDRRLVEAAAGLGVRAISP
jgi:predicted nucleic acid-binding protein